jgi:PAS domain S-box-containing protein
MFSGFSEEALAMRALDLGAASYVTKTSSLDDVLDELLHGLAPPPGSVDRQGGEEPEPGSEEQAELDTQLLDQQVERFRNVFEDATIGMATMTLQGTVVRANDALCRVLDRAADDLLGASYGVAVGDETGVEEAIVQLNEEGVDVVTLEHATASTHLSSTLSVVRDSGGRSLYLFAQCQDLSRQREAEFGLRMSERRFRLLVEAVRDYAIFMLDPAGRISSWNAGAERINGWSEEEILGQHFRTFYPPEQQQSGHPEHELELALRDGVYEEEGRRVRKDGTEYWAHVTITAVFDDGGTHIGFAKVTRDVSGQRQAEQRLRESEARFRLMVDAVRDYAIFMLDTEGRVASWNLGAQRTKGWAAEEIVGRHFRTFYPPEQQAAKHPEHELELALRDGVYEEEGWRVRKDGSRFWAHVTITTVRDETGRHIGFAKVTRDHTERMQLLEQQGEYALALADANAELEQANQELAAAAEEQARFLAVTAHELRSPIGVLGMSARMLAESWDGLEASERAELLGGMQSSAVRLQRLLNDLLVTARLQAATLDLDVQELDLAETLELVLRRLRITHPDVVIEAELPDGLTVRADGDRLAQMLDNLVTNAAVHGESPIRVSGREVDGRVELHVSDAGGGVGEDLRGRLFERFAARGGMRSTGLGLHIVRELARAQDGDASYRPEDNTFVVVLPSAGGAS